MLQKESFKVIGLDCQEEVGLLKKVLESKSGVFNLQFEVLKAKMTVEYEDDKISLHQIMRDVQAETGMEIRLWKERHLAAPKGFIEAYGRLLLTIFSGLSIGVGAVAEYLGYATLASGLYLISIVTAGSFIVVKAFFSLKRLRADMHVLMVVAVLGALSIDQWMEASVVTFLFSLSVFLEHMTLNKARKEIASLVKLSPTQANVLEEGLYKQKNIEQVKLEDVILVKPGENVPIDAVIVKGSSSLDQSSITGESLPAFKTVGDKVFAGTLNQEASIECRVIAKSQDTVLAKMKRLIEEAQSKRSTSEKWIEIFASIYTPCVIVLALMVGLIVPIVLGEWLVWIYRSLVVLVIACPCALVISTPVTIIAGLTAAAKLGVLIKGGVFLELPRKLQAVAFDKTGTLTYGKPSIQKIIPLAKYDAKELLGLAASLEFASVHPLASAILDKAKKENIVYQRADDVKILAGKGMEGMIQGEMFWVGSHKLMHEKKLETGNMHELALELEDAGHSVVAIGDTTQIYGLMSVADSPRIHLQQVMQELKEAGIKKTIMLTGDNTACASAIAKVSGVDEFFSEMLPQDKVEAVEELKEKYRYVAMVGDGVNDAAAMASASLGIAMGAVGTDAAIGAADITLMTDDLTKLPWLIRHSKKVMQLIWQNVVFALLVKAIFLAFAILGEASLWMAIASDTGASFLVILNGLRILKK